MTKGTWRRAGWIAVGLLVGGSTFALAAASGTAKDVPDDAPGFTISHEVRTDPELPDATLVRTTQATLQSHTEDHAVNHGLYVSAAAHCEDVDDAEDGVSFEAPEDCDTDGRARGEYVSTVARSDAGRPSQATGRAEDRAEGGAPAE